MPIPHVVYLDKHLEDFVSPWSSDDGTDDCSVLQSNLKVCHHHLSFGSLTTNLSRWDTSEASACNTGNYQWEANAGSTRQKPSRGIGTLGLCHVSETNIPIASNTSLSDQKLEASRRITDLRPRMARATSRVQSHSPPRISKLSFSPLKLHRSAESKARGPPRRPVRKISWAASESSSSEFPFLREVSGYATAVVSITK